MKLADRGRMDDGAALEELFANLTVTADWTVGLLTAIGSGPDAISPALWIPEIMPSGAFDEDPASRAKVDLLARLYGAIAETLRTTPEIICPEPDKPAQEAVDFCTGYLHGARMHEKWRGDEAATAKLAPFEALVQNVEHAESSTLKTHRERLGKNVAELHTYWQSKRQVVHTTPKVGRNDPCPCGSGKKHKKCCLAKQA
jgi:uncharacterized protein